MKMLTLTVFLASTSLAAPLGFQQAWENTSQQNPDLQNARSELQSASDDWNIRQQDPTALASDLLGAEQAFMLARVNLKATELQVRQSLLNQYTQLLESQKNIEVLKQQLELSRMKLNIQKAKLQLKNATALDVKNAEQSVQSDLQSLETATNTLPIYSLQLSKLFGQNLSNLEARPLPAPAPLTVKPEDLKQNLASQLSSVVQASQNVKSAELQVTLSNNDYTPASTLNDARSTLDARKRTLESTLKTASNTLSDTYQKQQDFWKKVQLQQKALANSQEALKQTEVRFKNGQVAKVDVLQSQLNVLNSELALLQAENNFHKGLLALGVAAGVDVGGPR